MKRELLFPLTLAAALFLNGCAKNQVIPDGEPFGREDGYEGIVYGKQHAFRIKAPTGWILDNQSGVSDGLHAVFYPQGSSWRDSPAVMYVNTAPRDPGQELRGFIENDIEGHRRHGKNLKVTTGEPIQTSDEKIALVSQFSGDRWGNFESVAYIEERAVFVIVALTSRDKSAYEGALEAFEQLVRSYYFVTEDVRIKK